MASFDAKRWAEALMAAAGSDAPAAAAALDDCSAVLEAAGPKLRIPSGRAAEASLSAAFFGAGIPRTAGETVAVKLVLLLARRGRLSRLPSVAAAARAMADAEAGLVRVVAETAVPLNGELRAALREKLLARTGARNIELIERIDPGLIGGMRIVVGSERIDGSIRKRLETMAASMGVAGRGGNQW